MKYIYYILQWTWGILQNIIGLVIFLLNINRPHYIYNGAVVTRWKRPDSLGMGMFIFHRSNDKYVLSHEYGHTIQSIILGPLFLFVIGIPSIIWAGCFGDYRKRNNIDYYSVFQEKWATELGKKYTKI